jgi:uncharacterized membrane protein YhaH (DUF805 family)
VATVDRGQAMNIGNLFFGFDGRINRSKYWLAALVYFAILVVLAAVDYATDQGFIFQAISGMLNIVILISSIAVGVKRLHDRNKSGWYMALFYILPGILVAAGALVGVTHDESTTITAVLGLSASAIGIWALVELGCLRGTIGGNRYGPDPIAPEILTPPVHTH